MTIKNVFLTVPMSNSYNTEERKGLTEELLLHINHQLLTRLSLVTVQHRLDT